MRHLLDTHVLLWWLEAEERLTKAQRRLLDRATAQSPLLVSEISLWEIALLHDLRRIRLARPLREWLEQATAPPLIERCRITPAIAAEVAALPSVFQRDPADRILVATARVLGATLVTRDGRIIEAGLVDTL